MGVKNMVDRATPTDWKDVGIRTVKTAVVAFVALLLKDGLGHAGVSTVEAAADAAWVAGGTFALNAVLTWANS